MTADELAADGIEIDLNGEAVPLILDFGALRVIERSYGSLDAFSDAVILGSKGQLLGMLEIALTACLQHLELTPAALERKVRAAIGPPLDWDRLERYKDAIVDAGVQARLLRRLPAGPPAEGGADAAQEAASPGPSGTTSPPSGMDAPSGNSGA